MTRLPLFVGWLSLWLLTTGSGIEIYQVALAERPHIPAIKVNSPPKIDGDLNDEAWQTAAKVTGFWRTDRDQLAEEQTEVLICYDDTAIYVAFICHDSQPNLIRTQQRKRGGAFQSDDFITINIDPLNQPLVGGGNFYAFSVNPLGTQNEWVPGGAAEKIEWRGDWQARAKITEKGWQVEMAIPFCIFRLPRKPSAFALWFSRSVPPPRLEDSTFPYRRGQAVSNTAEWGPLDLPKFKSPMLFMPATSLLMGEAKRGIRTGLDAKQHLPNGLRWQMTLNPDFYNIEDVVETIDFTYTSRFLPDRRPFFSEGWGYFPPPFMFYSRLVEDVLAGTKFFGRVGRTSVGILGVYETHSHRTLASRLSYNLDKKWSVEGNYAHRTGTGRFPAYRLALNGNIPSKNDWLWNLGGDWVYGGADAWSLYFGRFSNTPGRLHFFLNYGEIGDYRPSIGFKPEVNFKEFIGNLAYFDRYEKGTVLYWGSFAFYHRRRFRGGLKKGQLLDQNENLGAFVTGRKGWSISSAYNKYRRPPFLDRTFHFSIGWDVFDPFRSGNLSYQWGRRAGQSYRFLSLAQSFRLPDRWSLNLRYEQLRHRRQTYQLVLSGVYDLTPEQSIVFRWVKGSVPKPGDPQTLLPVDNIYFGFRQFSRKGTDLYLLLGEPNAYRTELKLFVKVIQVF